MPKIPFPQRRRWILGFVLLGAVLVIPHGCDLLWGNGPMNLHGKVIDQMGNPVPGMPVTFTASAWTRFQIPIPAGQETTWLVHDTTAADGTFAIHAGWGRVLYPGQTGDLGRLNGNVPGPFHFGWGARVRENHGDPAHPVLFMSWNDRFKRIISGSVSARVAKGWYVLGYHSGRFSEYGTGSENLEVMVVRPAGTPRPPYDWALEIRGIDEVADANGPLKTEAPKGPYTQSLRFPVIATDPHWSTKMTVHLYSKGTDLFTMSPVYAGVDLSVALGSGGAEPIVTIHYIADFGNSRDLVPGPVNPTPYEN